MGVIEIVLLRINNYRKDLNIMYKVDVKKRDVEWNNKVDILKNDYQNSLNDIQIGKINSTYKQNLESINKVQFIDSKNINKQKAFDNLIYNNKLARVRDIHPILYFIQDNKIYYTVQTSQKEAIPKPLQDELNINSLKEYIQVIDTGDGKYLSNAVYIIEAKNKDELNYIIKNIEQNKQLKEKFFSDKKDNYFFYKKEKAFELFYNNVLKEKPEILINNVFEELNINNDVVTNFNGSLIDVTFDKYIDDNIDKISNYDVYCNESWLSYLKLYENDLSNKNKNDPSDI